MISPPEDSRFPAISCGMTRKHFYTTITLSSLKLGLTSEVMARSMKFLIVWTALYAVTGTAAAATITFSGVVTQSTQDGTGPAINNPALNGIIDGDLYTVNVSFTGTLSGIGSYNPLPNASVVFSDGSISETAFTSAYLTVSPEADPSRFDISFLGCLSTGSGCFVGNSLSANFSVAASGFGSSGEAATAISGLFPPLDLLEDDGTTDIQASVTDFSNPGASAAPEPSTAVALFLGFGLLLLSQAAKRCRITSTVFNTFSVHRRKHTCQS